MHLIVTPDKGEPNPTWSRIEDAIGGLQPGRSVVLCRPDNSHIRADGARLMFTIAFYQDAKASPLLVGRPSSGLKRGKAILSGNRALVTPREYWSSGDGVEVFRAFFEGRDLNESFVLRDPQVEYSDAEIRRML
jgi:hypothetical protein